MEFLERTNMLINTNSLKNKTIAVFGLGGVGCYVIEGLVRAGISSFILVDYDVISKTNINRHLLAFNETIGFKKTVLQKERILKIQPKAKIQIYDLMWNQETANQIDFTKIDFIVDAIDMVSSKILLIQWAKEKNIPIISCMGTGNRLNPFLFEITDISKTSVCPLAKTMRYELKKKKYSSRSRFIFKRSSVSSYFNERIWQTYSWKYQFCSCRCGNVYCVLYHKRIM